MNRRITVIFTFFVFALVSLLACRVVNADTNQLEPSVEDSRIFQELTKLREYDEKGLPYINIEEANRQGLSQEAIYVGERLNTLTADMKREGKEVVIRRVKRSLLPVASYGNFCGKGNNGYDSPAIDDLDQACYHHDLCFQGFGQDNQTCNQEFRDRLEPILASNAWYTYKGAYARAAYALFY
ncbi:phospholipase [Streptococcus didelphis]|uniref:Phospholipase n=1 Tax=Streptococcus didelphis TaxID=102886 RepID=A0ABY9LIA0_9STRE|nr:hypothetical protein [Streptococcus didelphis]WMB28559.1 phospholipase [Streptococcus didelphis]WMB29231.1 phospholipase [Streptococcus didelphis]